VRIIPVPLLYVSFNVEIVNN